MFVLTARNRAKPGQGNTVATAMKQITPLARAEPGCELYVVNRSIKGPDEFILYERYRDEDALDGHRDSAPFEEIVQGRVIPLLESREFDLYTLLDG
jgi:quinol monooxygenase YgiN